MSNYQLTDRERYTVIFALKKAIASFKEEHDRTDNPRMKIHAENAQEVLDKILEQASAHIAAEVA